jgi:hypothetical protein
MTYEYLVDILQAVDPLVAAGLVWIAIMGQGLKAEVRELRISVDHLTERVYRLEKWIDRD